jgi:hypothetical protein
MINIFFEFEGIYKAFIKETDDQILSMSKEDYMEKI